MVFELNNTAQIQSQGAFLKSLCLEVFGDESDALCEWVLGYGLPFVSLCGGCTFKDAY